MFTDADITVYNKKYDRDKRIDVWYRTVLRGVSQYINVNASAVNDAGRNENVATFRVPDTCDKYVNYMPAIDYSLCGHPEFYWTFETGDLIVPGVCPVEIIQGESTLLKRGIKAFRVKSVSDNRRGMTPHLRARCE